MARKKEPVRTFFKLRHEINATLEALSNEILMCLQAMETAIDLGDLNSAGKKILQERVAALRAICMSDEET